MRAARGRAGKTAPKPRQVKCEPTVQGARGSGDRVTRRAPVLAPLGPAFSVPARLRGSLHDSAGPTRTFLLKTSRQ